MITITAFLVNQVNILNALKDEFLITGVVDCSYFPSTGRFSAVKNAIKLTYNRYGKKNSLYNWAKANKTPFQYYGAKEDRGKTGLIKWLSAQQPDVFITYGVPILPPQIFKIPKKGAINVHPAPLPRYRGGSPILWQIINDEKTLGLTFHLIDEGIDTGPIIYQTKSPYKAGKSKQELFSELDQLAARLFPDIIKQVYNGEFEAITQSKKSPGVFARNLKNNELLKLIDWRNWPVDRIWAILRYQEYWPQQIACKGRSKFTIWKTGLYRKEPSPQPIENYVIEDQGDKKLLRLNDGYIELIPQFSPRDMIKSIFALE